MIIEQHIRSLKLGANNWLFAASEEGAEAVAIFNTLVCTCKINGINVFKYLNDVLGSLGESVSCSAYSDCVGRLFLLRKISIAWTVAWTIP